MFQQLEIGGRDVYTHTLAHICQVVVNNMEKNEVGQRWEECWGLPIKQGVKKGAISART